MKHMWKRLASLLLALVLVVSLLPDLALTAHAAVTARIFTEAGEVCKQRYNGCIQLLDCKHNGADRMSVVDELRIIGYSYNNGNVTLTFFIDLADGYSSKKGTISFTDADCTQRVNVDVEYSYELSYAKFRINRGPMAHTGEANCVAAAVCSLCGTKHQEIDPNKHSWSAWTQNSDGKTHTRTCALSASHKETQTCSGGSDTCVSPATCTTCNRVYGKKLEHHYTIAVNNNTFVQSCDKGCGHKATAALTAQNAPYTGSAIETAKITYTGSEWLGDKPSLTYADNTEAGTATATMTLADNTVSVNFTVEKAEAGVTHPTAKALTYTGKAQTLITEGAAQHGTISYRLGNGEWGQTLPAATAVGSYKVFYKVEPVSANYAAVEATEIAAGIAAAPITGVSVTAKPVTYTGSVHTPEVETAATTVDGAQVSFAYSTAPDGTYSDLPSFTEAGNHTVYYKASADNHADASGSFTFTVNKQTVPAPAIAGKVYNGQLLTADITDGYLYTVTKNEGGTEGGEYDVELTLKDPANYKWESTEDAALTLKFAITPADNSWIAEPGIDGWTYGSTPNAPVMGEAVSGAVSVKYVGTDNSGNAYDSAERPLLAGAYKAVFTAAATGNYGALTKEVPFTVSRAALTDSSSFTYTAPALTYNGQKQAVTVAPAESLAGVKAEDITVNYSAEPKNAGDYTFTVSVAQTPNYKAARLEHDSWKFTIAKAQPVISWEKNEFTYNAAPQGAASVTLVGEDTYSGTVAYRYKFAGKSGDWVEGLPKNVETYIVEATVAESANYESATATNDQISIKPLAITPTVQIDPVSFTYDGTAKEPDVKVLAGGVELAPREYTLTYQNATQVGAASVTVSPKAGGNYTFTGITKTYLILPDASALEGITTENVTSAQQAAIDEIQAAMKDVAITDADAAAKKQWEDLLDRCGDLEKKIEDTAAAVEDLSEAIEDLPAQPTAADLDAIGDALEQYEQLEDNLTNAEKEALAEEIRKLEAQKEAITEVNNELKEITDGTGKLDKDDLDFGDKATIKALQKKIDDLEDSTYLTAAQKQTLADAEETLEELKAEFAEAEKVEKQLKALPATADPDDEKAIAAYKAAKKAYAALGGDQAKVDPAAVKKLSTLKTKLTDYRIIKYSTSRWSKSSSSGLTVTANGHFDNFIGVKMDGKYIDSENYTAKSGSTVVTLKASYLKKLKTGKHTVAVCFGDGDFTGEADFTFKVNDYAVTPATGDSSNILLWSGMSVCSAMALAALVIFKKRGCRK